MPGVSAGYAAIAFAKRLLMLWRGVGIQSESRWTALYGHGVGAQMATVSGYDAFISYSHQKDRTLGPALQAQDSRHREVFHAMPGWGLTS